MPDDLPEFLRDLRPETTEQVLTRVTGIPPTPAQQALVLRYPALLTLLKAAAP